MRNINRSVYLILSEQVFIGTKIVDPMRNISRAVMYFKIRTVYIGTQILAPMRNIKTHSGQVYNETKKSAPGRNIYRTCTLRFIQKRFK
jgi:hypothetical protein